MWGLWLFGVLVLLWVLGVLWLDGLVIRCCCVDVVPYVVVVWVFGCIVLRFLVWIWFLVFCGMVV